MKYEFINNHRDQYSVRLQCRVLGVSRSGYYHWLQRTCERPDRALRISIRAIFNGSRQTYGIRRVTAALRHQGWRCNRKRVARIMRSEGLQAVSKRAYKTTTTSKHDRYIAGNLLKRDFTASAPNRKWLSDITYVSTAEGWLYLATVLDLYSRRIVGWSVSDRLKDDLVIEAYNRAVALRQPPKDLTIFHSDRGSQYASTTMYELHTANKMRISMSGKGDCWDNAPQESFFATLKTECVHRHRFATRREAMTNIADYVEHFYNRIRLHSSLGYRSPVEFELQSRHP